MPLWDVLLKIICKLNILTFQAAVLRKTTQIYVRSNGIINVEL